MSDIKTVNISGGAAVDISGGKKRRQTRKKQEGGSEEVVRGVSPIMNTVKGIESASSLASTAAAPNSNTWLKYPTNAPVPPKININIEPVAKGGEPVLTQQGGNKHVKVELKKKLTAKKVHLNPKKSEVQKQIKKHHTRKHRKVTLGISNLHKRITRAKKLHKEAKEMPIDKLKEKLIKGGLIKSNSKAPEKLLRQIASDAALVAKKAL
jgi:hypothetical protein